MLLIGKPDFTLTSDRRLVKASEVATAKSADEIIAAAEAEAARIREEAKAAKFFGELQRKAFEKRCGTCVKQRGQQSTPNG